MFKVGDNVMLKMPLVDAIKLDPWIGHSYIQENVVYTVANIWNAAAKPTPDDTNIILEGDGLWLQSRVFKIAKNNLLSGFVIED